MLLYLKPNLKGGEIDGESSKKSRSKSSLMENVSCRKIFAKLDG
jgi:hypothetical protein